MPALLSDVKRLSAVAQALVRSGLGHFALTEGLSRHLPFWHRMLGTPAPDPATAPAKARAVLEELGGAYIKLGQLLSVRPDLVPAAYADEFKKLQDKVPPFDAETAKAIIARALGSAPDTLFSSFDPDPVGSASIAQAHRAVLRKDGPAVVKVQRPGVAEVFAEDIDIMKRVAASLDRHHLLAAYMPSMIVEEFERYTRRELDFRIEAASIRRFERMFQHSRDIVIPRVFSAARDVLVMSELRGTPLSSMADARFDRRKVVRVLVDGMIDAIFVHSTFHADLHPGNILVLPGNRVGLLDFGITGTLTPELRKRGIEMYGAIVNNDSTAAVNALCKASLTQPKDVDALRREVAELFLEWQDEQHRLPTHTFHRLFLVARRHGIHLPSDLVLVGKALVTLEATCSTLEPDFNLVDHALGRFRTVRDKELRAAFSLKRIRTAAATARQSFATFSEDALAVMDRLKRGTVHIDIKDTDIRHLGKDINTSSNRLSFALVISALLIFSALLFNVSPLLGPISVYSIVGIGLAVLVLLAMFISMGREGKPGFDDHTTP